MYMAGKYFWNIIRVDIEVSRGSKIFKMRDVQQYPRAPKTVHFQPQVIKNPSHNIKKKILITVDPICLALKIG